MTTRATLVTDGSSDQVLLPILRWTWGRLTNAALELTWADLRLARRRTQNLSERLALAVELYPCTLLFVHRDAEKQDPALRRREIEAANETTCRHVCVVPVRMQEAWLLHDEAALRRAAGRPSGKDDLQLPPANRWEDLPDPKQVLHDALRAASGKRGRRAATFKPEQAVHRLASLVTDWTPLCELDAFQRLEAETRQVIVELGIALAP